MPQTITLFLLGFLLTTLMACTPRVATDTAFPSVLPETKTPANPQTTYAGSYDVTVSGTPAGTVSGLLLLTEVEGTLAGSFVSGGSTTALQSVSTTEDGLRISFYSSQYQTDVDMKLQGTPGAEVLTGMTLGSYKTVATRK